MIIGASSFAGPLPELASEVESIELYIPKLEVYEGTKLIRSRINRLKDILSSYDLSTSIHAPYFSDAPNYPHELIVDTARLTDKTRRLLKESIGIAGTLGSGIVVIHPGRINGIRERCFEKMISGLSLLSKFARDVNVTLGLENKEGTDQNNLCISARELIRALEEIGSPNLRATFDIGHANLTCEGNQDKLREFAKELKNHIAHIHIHDNKGFMTEKFWGDLHGAPGTGVIDYSLLKDLRFKGVHNLEVFSLEDVRMGKQVLLGLDDE
ncbi:MAG: sugar phosphate isomerase/epimerase [Candidatus Methanoperedenaceae archaeon]|nr:MAG: sugar phosphate isomerase/epimerase [Candidatus Methanoperedenaceae archaeon]